MKKAKRMVFAILFLLVAMSVYYSSVDAAPENNKEKMNPKPQIAFDYNRSFPDTIDHRWLEETDRVPAWAGITDLGQLPEYIFAQAYWETTGNNWPTINELLAKYNLHYPEINAKNLNDVGFAVYSQKAYLDAVALFRYAAMEDPAVPKYHYNLACSAALLLEQILNGTPSDIDEKIFAGKYGNRYTVPFVVLDEIFSRLAITLFLDKDYLVKIQDDKALAILRPMERFGNFMYSAESGDLWLYYGYFSYEYYGTNSYMVTLDGMQSGDRIGESFLEDGRILESENPFLFFCKIAEHAEFIPINKHKQDDAIWEEAKIKQLGYKPAWKLDLSSEEVILDIFPFSHIIPKQDRAVIKEIQKKDAPENETSKVIFKCITTLPSPEIRDDFSLVFPGNIKLQRIQPFEFIQGLVNKEEL